MCYCISLGGVGRAMKARLIKEESGAYSLLCPDGTIVDADTVVLKNFLRNVRYIDEISGEKGGRRWDDIAPDMFAFEGETFAYINDDYTIIIKNFLPFETLFEIDSEASIDSLLSVAEYAELVGKSIEQVKVHLRNKRIPNARKIGRDWVIHKDSVAFYPTDNRITTGRHIGHHQRYYKRKSGEA